MVQEFEEVIKDNLRYDPESGKLYWKVSRGRVKAGDEAGSIQKSGYITLGIGGRVLKAHRVAWFLYHGKWPDNYLDHLNKSKSDNRIENLRDATPRENTENSTVYNFGVGLHRGKWRARISVRGKQKHLGHFETEDSAKYAYLKYKEQLDEPRQSSREDQSNSFGASG